MTTKKSLSTVGKYALTFGVYFLFLVYGLSYSIVSPTLLSLCEQLSVSFASISHGILLRSFSFCMGSLIGSAVFTLIDRRIGLILFILLLTIATLAISLTTSYSIFLVSMSIMGISSGAIDVATTVIILSIWRSKSNPFMQGLHFSFAIGMVASPMLAAPFLTPDHRVQGTSSSSHSNYTSNNISGNFTLTPATTIINDKTNDTLSILQNSDFNYFITKTLLFIKSDQLHLVVPFAICAANLLIAALVQVILNCTFRHSNEPTAKDASVASLEKTPSDKSNSKLSFIIAGCLLLSFYVVCEMNSFVFAPNYATFVGYSEETGAYLAFIMSTSFAIFRLISILVATKVPTLAMLYIHLATIGLGNFIIYFAGSSSLVALALGLCVLGAGLSAVFAALYAFFEEVVHMTNGICGLFMFASALSVSITPIFEGAFLPSHPPVFVYINLIALILCFFILRYLHVAHRSQGPINK